MSGDTFLAVSLRICYNLKKPVERLAWCATVGKAELENSALTIKQQAINASISRGNATDDIKSASNDIVTNIKKLLGLTACGNNGEAIIRDTITPLITPDTQVYQQLERLIFG